MRVVKTYYMRKHRYQHSLALMVKRGHKWTTCIFLEYPLTIEKVLNRDADQFKDAYHSIIPDDPQVSKVARALRHDAGATHELEHETDGFTAQPRDRFIIQ